ncbi:PD-(D/E)XK nuclease family protein [Halanaerobium sp. Z-7514]|uniref:PD-(D/E)XK nuclease family protein n=1 Tax=Halanaerobium polyolivorans TaxID=2886943 RepID=A0AAW4WV67_9FIRM|nr:PD-(D/E)XK nuclease family protein [Halanaerobium polyolivorans]MCC3145003.1 PD-(D/E)XK nuclease family protein [Halanaerobium polyolivorans]
MTARNLSDLYFSQSALAIFNKCRRKFRYRYLDGLYWPSEWGMKEEFKEDIERGRKFHLLAERYYNKSIADTVLKDNDQLQAWFMRLKKYCPFNENIIAAEQEIRFKEKELKFLAKYDLLAYNSNNKSISIYDWKTDQKSLYQKDIKNSIQSRFYLYLMFEAGYQYFADSYDLEGMPKLIYWNPRYPKEEISINYDQAKYQRDSDFFKALLEAILAEEEFALTEDLNLCRFCEYRPICRSKKPEGRELVEEDLDLDLDWEVVEEMEFL